MISGKLCQHNDDDDDDDDDKCEYSVQMFVMPYSECTKVRDLAYVRRETFP